MVRYCFIEKCKTSRYKKNSEDFTQPVTMHSFPKDPVLRKKWVEAVVTFNNQQRALDLPKTAQICGNHFTSDCFEQFGFSAVRLKRKAVPSIFPYSSNESYFPVTTIKKEEDTTDIPLTLQKKIRYPGDITSTELENMSPERLKESVVLLKRTCEKNKCLIKRLHTQRLRQKKKIESLTRLLTDWQKRYRVLLNQASPAPTENK